MFISNKCAAVQTRRSNHHAKERTGSSIVLILSWLYLSATRLYERIAATIWNATLHVMRRVTRLIVMYKKLLNKLERTHRMAAVCCNLQCLAACLRADSQCFRTWSAERGVFEEWGDRIVMRWLMKNCRAAISLKTAVLAWSSERMSTYYTR